MSALATQKPADAALQTAADVAPIFHMIERAARDPSVDIDKFERLVAMQERAQAARARQDYAAAIAAARGEMPPVIKTREVDFQSQKGRTHYRHEDLAGIAKVVDPVLHRHGLSYRYRSEQTGPRLRITCIISHASGHSEETTLEADNDASGNKNSIQAIGSAATYLQRYTLKLALGLAAAHDDDGATVGASASITDEQVMTLREMIEASSADPARFLKFMRVPTLADIPAAKYQTALDALKRKAEGSNG